VKEIYFYNEPMGTYLSIVQPADRYLRYNVTPQWLEVGELCLIFLFL
jgi:hypothetical protein